MTYYLMFVYNLVLHFRNAKVIKPLTLRKSFIKIAKVGTVYLRGYMAYYFKAY